ELDLAIEGNGFLQVLDPLTQTTMYTRSGNLDINADGTLVIGSAQTGRPLEPPITIPPNTSGIQITATGQVLTRQPDELQFTQIGQLQLAQFINPDGLAKVGENLYQETDASSTAIPSDPGTNGLGTVR